MSKEWICPDELVDIPREKFDFAFAEQGENRMPESTYKARGVAQRLLGNPSAVAGAVIMLLIITFCTLVGLFYPISVEHCEPMYASKPPRSRLLGKMGIVDGCEVVTINKSAFTAALAIGAEMQNGVLLSRGVGGEHAPIREVKNVTRNQNGVYFTVVMDQYLMEGFRFITVDNDTLDAIKKWEQENGKGIIYPMIDTKSHHPWAEDANIWYKTSRGKAVKTVQKDGKEVLEEVDIENGDIPEANYLLDENGDIVYQKPSDNTMWRIRVLCYNYYQFKYGTEPYYLLGSDNVGYDICSRLARGVFFSLSLATAVSVINLLIGLIYGAVAGYYGGVTDALLERVREIIGAIPVVATVTLIQMRFATPLFSVAFGLIAVGWVSIAGRVRSQFYRFKGAQYVEAARMLGVSDAKIMLGHILPNAAGSIITSAVLMVPSVIFSESMLSYLGIAQGESVGLGSMLASARDVFTVYPYQMLFPALTLSLMMIAFNLFGNGLREAMDPSMQ